MDESQNPEADALRRELQWTRRQHARWIQERSEMVAAITKLRARVQDSESHFQRNGDLELVDEIDQLSAALREAASWNRELTAARDWHNSQAIRWKEEAERLAAALKVEEVRTKVLMLEKSRAANAKLEELGPLFEEQKALWDEERTHLQRTLESQSQHIDDLLHSWSWRMTGPLRRLVAVTRRKQGPSSE